jgi:hypothetical protein
MLGLANAERRRAVDVCYLANQNMSPSSIVLESFPAVEYFLQWSLGRAPSKVVALKYLSAS